MSLLLLSVLVMAALVAGYTLYGGFIARQYRLDDAVATPATRLNDGVDFVPARPFYLLGQHFSAIAAAGPIVGPIAACLAFGWLPSILWITLGVIFIGAVHDFSALIASIRHGANSIAEIARQNLGRRAWLAFIAFIWIALLYVIVAFADVTASTFLGQTEELQGEFSFNAGGAVAAASTMYLLLALLMGVVQRKLSPPMWLLTVIFVPATLGVVWLGTKVSTVLVFDLHFWHLAILIYCFVASLLPMWLLQQPRGYLGGFVLYLVLGTGVVGVVFGGFQIQQPAIVHTPTGSVVERLLFPFLFVTIACGACSGFHGLVCGGTTSKQVARESHCKPIGYGAMLLEGLVALIALATVMIVLPADIAGRAPGKLYGDGIARFLAVLLGERWLTFAATFGAMAFSTFVFDTLDVATRLGRYLLQELAGGLGWGATSRSAGILAAASTAFVPLLILLSAPEGAWRQFWVLFGTSNQLLASLTLLGVSVWLYRSGRRTWYTVLPMLFVMTATVSALLVQMAEGAKEIADGGLRLHPSIVNGFVATALLVLAIIFVIEGLRTVRDVRRGRGVRALATEPSASD
ncbi:MAG TPA: carbon starvation CstA family protein [Terriglobales bacterium]|nr:carbon starvation CstA family protein [Terriglobales bacterium]